jgi:hypothetical protein
VILSVELDLGGQTFPDPVRMQHRDLPLTWQ